MIHNCIRLLSIIIRSVENKHLNLIHASLDVQWWDTRNIVNLWLFYVFEFCLWQLYFILEHLLLVFMFSVVRFILQAWIWHWAPNPESRKNTFCASATLSWIALKMANELKLWRRQTSLIEEDIQTELPIKLPIALVEI